jgi:anti-sigma factor RsiW
MTPSPETIAAYADGELEGEALREVEAAVAADPALQAQVAAHRALKRRLGAHFAPTAEESVPDSLVRAVRGGGEVVDFADAARRRARPAASSPWRRYAGPALAASLVLGLVGVGLRQQQSSTYAPGEIAVALQGQLAETQSPQAPVRILLSFRDDAGAFCRGFSSAAQSGIACKDDRGWRLRKVVGGEEAAAGDYRQAGSADADVLAAIQDMARGEALDAQAERSAMQRGWRN